MNLGRSILLTVAGALLIGCGQKALFLTKSSRLAPQLREIQTVIFKPKPKRVQTVVYQPDAQKTPASTALTTPPVEAKVPAKIKTPKKKTVVAVFSPKDHPLGKVKPKFRSAASDSAKTARPKARLALALAPVKKTSAKKKPAKTTTAVAKPVENSALASLARLTPTRNASAGCKASLARAIPRRMGSALKGTQVVTKIMNLSGAQRDAFVAKQLLSGNMPSFLRNLIPVTFNSKLSNGQKVQVTICVTPDYLAAGSDRDFVRVPMGLPAAAKVADKFGFLLPTTKMVDEIYAQARIRMAPSPMKPNSQMSSTSYLWEHNQTVEGQRVKMSRNPDLLTAGQKKDLVLSKKLRSAPGRVAIYGWHRTNGAPIQPLSTVHGALYADYSHGIRLVSATAFINGRPVPLADLLADRHMAGIVSKEGPISSPRRLMASLYR